MRTSNLIRAFVISIAALCTACATGRDAIADETFRVVTKQEFSSGNVEISGPHSIAQLEAESLEHIRKEAPRAPQLPFGFINEQWIAFKSKVREGDELYSFWAKDTQSVAARYGATGIALVRDNKVIAVFETGVY